YPGTEGAPAMLLLSHDPSHWDAIVRPDCPDIGVMFAGHIYGSLMRLETGVLRLCLVLCCCVQWGGVDREGSQYLSLNRCFGCLGFLGRIGMPPELTIIELKKA